MTLSRLFFRKLVSFVVVLVALAGLVLFVGSFVAVMMLFEWARSGEQAEPSWSSDLKLSDAKLVRRTFTLGGTSFAIVVPEAAIVS
jgi:hypothetical protein